MFKQHKAATGKGSSDHFIATHLSENVLEEIIEQLKENVFKRGSGEHSLEDILQTACAQDLFERGERNIELAMLYCISHKGTAALHKRHVQVVRGISS